MKNVIFAFAALLAVSASAVVFAPKEYVDQKDEEIRSFTRDHVAQSIEPLCTKLALASYMPLGGTNTADFTVGTIRSVYGHIDELEIGFLLTMGSWDLIQVGGVTLTSYFDSRYIRANAITNTVEGIVGAMNLSGGDVSQEDLLPFGEKITKAVMMAVVTNDLPNLTWDQTLEVAWKKSANNGCFYETAYTNVEILATGELK